jgi:hypothetical protein
VGIWVWLETPLCQAVLLVGHVAGASKSCLAPSPEAMLTCHLAD